MRAGDLRHRLKLQKFVQGNPQGVDTKEWQDEITFWGKVSPLRGYKFLSAQQIQSEATHAIVCRANVGVQFTPLKRIVFDVPGQEEDRYFKIMFAANVDERNIKYEIMVKEETS